MIKLVYFAIKRHQSKRNSSSSTTTLEAEKGVVRRFWRKFETKFVRTVQLFGPFDMFEVAQDFETTSIPKGCSREHARIKSTESPLQ
jgi:hypothetical protein